MAIKKKATKKVAPEKKAARAVKKSAPAKPVAAKKAAKPVAKPVKVQSPAKTAAKGKPVVKKSSKMVKPAKPVAKAAKPVKGAKAVKPAKIVKSVKEEPKKLAPVKFVPVPPKKPVLPAPKNDTTKQYTQSELFDAIRAYCGFATRNQARDYYEGFSTMLQAALKNGYKLVLPGLGKIQVRKTKPRKGRNPITQETIMIPAKRKIAFTAIKALKSAVL